MSVFYQGDVFCDSEECFQWLHGIGRYHVAPTKKAARRAAVGENKHWSFGVNGKDYCPSHASEPEREGET